MSVAEDRVPPGSRIFECALNEEHGFKDRLVASSSGPRGIYGVYLEAQHNYLDQIKFTSVCVKLSREDQIALRDWLTECIEDFG